MTNVPCAYRAILPLLMLAAAAGGRAEDLPRRASLGLAMTPPAAGATQGPVVDRVYPDQTAERLGLKQGDVILSVGGKPAPDSATVVAYARTLNAGDPVDIRILRAGKQMRLRGAAVGRPFERYRNAITDYGSVPFREGKLRDILVTPEGSAQPPVLFLLPGYACASIEPQTPNHPYRRLGEELVARGIAYYRIEKPYLGDSTGTADCNEIDFATELDAFRTGYNHLVKIRGVDPDRIFMLGHSLGGMQAPLIAAESPPRGVAAFGTVLRNWADYHHDIDVFQSFLFAGADPAEEAAGAERNRELLRRFYFGRETPAAIAAGNPQDAEALRNLLSWDGRERTLGGRSYKFNQELAHLPLTRAWRDVKTNVLALYGESDIVALNDEDHRLIADIADFYRPGTGRFVEVPGTSHSMELVGTRTEVREKTRAAGRVPNGPFNPAVVDALAAWIKDAMTRPPVRTQTYPTREPPADE
jgi:hypothetical protein